MKYIAVALAAAGLFATSAFAADAPQGREAVSIQVSTAGLDMTTMAGVEKFRDRVEKAVAAACNPGDRVGADLSPDFRCRREMAANVQPTIQQMAARASESRFGSNTGL
jgi:UrcA family protein